MNVYEGLGSFRIVANKREAATLFSAPRLRYTYPYMPSCPFCDLLGEERVLREGEHCFVIFSDPRLMPGHLLVIPKRHVGRLSELKEDERREVVSLAVEFEERILEKLAPGCDILQHYKPYVEESATHVDHLHVHLQPRRFEDELHRAVDPHKKPLYRELPTEEQERLSRLLRGPE